MTNWDIIKFVQEGTCARFNMNDYALMLCSHFGEKSGEHMLKFFVCANGEKTKDVLIAAQSWRKWLESEVSINEAD